MAKAQGFIGNFQGKIGNTVGYQLTTSNNKQTQGIRIYQPNVKNPKTSAQAEQRAKLAPINATYRALKMVIDRGIEGLPYGNKSRLAWLKQAFKAVDMPWYVKGAVINKPVICQLTKGSLPGINYETNGEVLTIVASTVTAATKLATVGDISTALLASYSNLKVGDQVTIVSIESENGGMDPQILSFVLDATNTQAISGFSAAEAAIKFEGNNSPQFVAVIISREGDAGEHLRSATFLQTTADILTAEPYDAASKTAAIKSYIASGAASTDWEQEPID